MLFAVTLVLEIDHQLPDDMKFLHGTTYQAYSFVADLFGLVFLVAGIAFKLGVVPFHMWIPDVYHGAPTAITLFIASAPKR